MHRMLFLTALAVAVSMQAEEKEIFHNAMVSVVEVTLAPGGRWPVAGKSPCAVVWMDGGTIESAPISGRTETLKPVRGALTSHSPGGRLRNAGTAAVRLVMATFPGPGSDEAPMGARGLAPSYKVLMENRYMRAYEIRIPAGHKEPKHTHKDRVLVVLSGAEVRHVLADGRTEPSSLQTGSVLWRKGGAHVGENTGRTDLWAVAIEPK